MGGLVWFDKIFQACQWPPSFIAYERGWVIFEYSRVFRSGGSLMKFSDGFTRGDFSRLDSMRSTISTKSSQLCGDTVSLSDRPWMSSYIIQYVS
jgi:hypothetical protein